LNIEINAVKQKTLKITKMKKIILKLSVILFVIFFMTISFNFSSSSNNTNNDVDLCLLLKMPIALGEATGNGDCGTGYMYFCGYFYGIDHPEFYAYEGPWLA
jgi:hypothetical protein